MGYSLSYSTKGDIKPRTLTQPMARLPLPEKKKAGRGPERKALGMPARQPYRYHEDTTGLQR